jgi:hypothetical protein
MTNPSPLNPESAAVQNYLNILQGVITRMATNSSNCKNWCITIVSAIVVAIADKAKPDYAFIALIPVILFCFLDAYYLAQERAFRKTYSEFVKKLHEDSQPENFSQDLFKVIPTQGRSMTLMTLESLSSFSIYPVYGTLVALILLARFLILQKG